MKSHRVKIAVLVVGALLMVSALAMAVVGTSEEAEQKAVVQYKIVPLTAQMNAQQLEAFMNKYGKDGWKFVNSFVVGPGPIPTQEVFLFTK